MRTEILEIVKHPDNVDSELIKRYKRFQEAVQLSSKSTLGLDTYSNDGYAQKKL